MFDFPLSAEQALGESQDTAQGDPVDELPQPAMPFGDEAASGGLEVSSDDLARYSSEALGHWADDPPSSIAARGVTGAGSSLPFAEQIQASFGPHDVSGIRAHHGEAATAASHQLGARAFALDQDVAFAQAPDLHTAAHEAAHVVQQRGGVQLAGGIDHAGDPYERHADEVADAVVAGRSATEILFAPGSDFPDPGAIERFLNGKMTNTRLRSIRYFEIVWKDPGGKLWVTARSRASDGTVGPVTSVMQ